jgi:hypothetical protein
MYNLAKLQKHSTNQNAKALLYPRFGVVADVRVSAPKAFYFGI